MGKRKRGRRRNKPRPQPTPDSSVLGVRKNEAVPPSPKTGRGSKLLIGLALLAVVLGGSVLILVRASGRTRVVRDGGLNVLLITLDTTRADRLGCYGNVAARTPNLDGLAAKGVLFKNAYCQVPLTLPSHASIMTAAYPFVHGVRNNGTYALGKDAWTLAEVLKAKGFRTAAFVASFSVDSRFGLDQGFDLYDDNFQENVPFKTANAERRAERVFAPFSDWLDRNAAEKFFCWVHFFDPHLPYDPPPSYKKDFLDRPYDGEIAYMDSYVGEIVRKLRDRNILGRTLIVLAGDHGEGLGEKVENGHGVFLYDMVMRVPLVFYSENNLPSGKAVTWRVRLIDIAPSIMDMLGLPSEGIGQGTSLIPYLEKKKNGDLEAYMETFYPRENLGWSEYTGLVAGDWKYICGPEPELFNLKADPAEMMNEASNRVSVLQDLSRRLGELIKSGPSSSAGGARTLSAEEQERLRSLGYASFTGAPAGGPLPDAKAKLDELRMFQQAQKYEFEGNYGGALQIYQDLLGRNSKWGESMYVSLALAQARLKDFEGAIQTLKKGIEETPGSVNLLARLGSTYLVTDRVQEAYDSMQKVLAVNPGHFDALTASAVILEAGARWDEARAFYERALAVEPENKFLRTNYALNLAKGGRVAEAIDLLSLLIRDYPEDAALYQDMGIFYGLLGENDKAVEYLEKAIGMSPAAAAYYNLAMIYKKMGRTEDAVRNLEEFLRNPGQESEQNLAGIRAELDRLKAQLIR